MNYFDCAYFDQTYFSTDCPPSGGKGGKGPVRRRYVQPILPQPEPLDEGDELMALF